MMDAKEIKEEVAEKVKEFAAMESDWYNKKRPSGILDSLQTKIVSRKLLVFLTATALFVWAGLDPDTWGMIAMCYIGGQSAIDFAKTWKGQ